MKKLIHILVFIITFISIFSYVEAREPSQEFDFKSIGFHGFYDLEIYEENGQTLARSIYDPIDSPHYTYNEEQNTWKDNHPGRNDIELQFPLIRDSGRTIWKELAGNEWIEESKTYIKNNLFEAVWNQDMLAYEMVNFEHDEGHPVFWLPMMGLLEVSDENKGYVNYCETIESSDFVIGESGVKIDFYVSSDHPTTEYWGNNYPNLANKYYSDIYLNNFNNVVKGQIVVVRLIDENITTINKTHISLNRDIWLHGDGTKILNQFVTGYNDEIGKNIDYVTLSIGYNKVGFWDVQIATFWNLVAIESAPNTRSVFDSKNLDTQLEDAFLIILEESESASPLKIIEEKIK